MEAKIRFSKKKEMCQVIVKIRILTNLKLGDTQKKVKNRRQKKRVFFKKKREIMAVSEKERIIMSMINVMKIIEIGIILFCQ